MYWPEKKVYLISSGAFSDGRDFALYWWTGNKEDKKPEMIRGVNEYGLSPEAIVSFPGNKESQLLLLSDDGDEPVDGKSCKKLKKTPDKQQFRGRWVSASIP